MGQWKWQKLRGKVINPVTSVQEMSQHKCFSWLWTLRALAAGLGGGSLWTGARSSAELPWANRWMKRCNQPRGERRKCCNTQQLQLSRHYFTSFEGSNEVPGAHLHSCCLYRTLFFLLVLSSALSVVISMYKYRHSQLFIMYILGSPGIITSWQGCLTLWVPSEGYVFAKWQLFKLNFPTWVLLQANTFGRGKYQKIRLGKVHFFILKINQTALPEQCHFYNCYGEEKMILDNYKAVKALVTFCFASSFLSQMRAG